MKAKRVNLSTIALFLRSSYLVWPASSATDIELFLRVGRGRGERERERLTRTKIPANPGTASSHRTCLRNRHIDLHLRHRNLQLAVPQSSQKRHFVFLRAKLSSSLSPTHPRPTRSTRRFWPHPAEPSAGLAYVRCSAKLH